MPENRPSVDELLGQIAEFEATIAGLQKNVTDFKSRLAHNREQFGDDVSKWPQI
ncbi:hypothetical protein ACFL52_00200 [Candidatus Margulisiibacteriota bacterium]